MVIGEPMFQFSVVNTSNELPDTEALVGSLVDAANFTVLPSAGFWVKNTQSSIFEPLVVV